jgi:DNA-binding transcriptional ArsR family regulator
MGHGASPDARPATEAELQRVAETLHALSTPSRLRILLHLVEGPCAAGELATAVGMEQSAVSHQLRILRQLGLVVGTRQGRSISYRLYDDHVAQLLDEARDHVEHLRLRSVDPMTS